MISLILLISGMQNQSYNINLTESLGLIKATLIKREVPFN